MKFSSGSRGRAPVGDWGPNPQKLNVLFYFQKMIVALKRGEAATISGIFMGERPERRLPLKSYTSFKGGDGAAEKGAAASPAPWIRHSLRSLRKCFLL